MKWPAQKKAHKVRRAYGGIAKRMILSGGSGDGAPEIALDQGVIRFEAAGDREEGFAGFDVACVDPDAVRRVAESRGLVTADGGLQVCGTRLRLLGPKGERE